MNYTNLRQQTLSVSALPKQGEIRTTSLLEYSNGIFQGQMSGNPLKKNGLGVFAFDNGDFYFGEWENDQIQGEGILFFAFGGFVHGYFQNSKLHGPAFLKFSNGEIYEGQWNNGLLEGEAFNYFIDESMWLKCKYVNGKFENLLEEGEGRAPSIILNHLSEMRAINNKHRTGENPRVKVLDFNDGQQFLGSASKNKTCGLGILRRLDGKHDIGFCDDGTFVDIGRINLQDGGLYDGLLKGGKFHGRGMYYNSTDKSWFYGHFENGECKKISKQGKGKYPLQIVEQIRAQHHKKSNHFVNLKVAANIFYVPTGYNGNKKLQKDVQWQPIKIESQREKTFSHKKSPKLIRSLIVHEQIFKEQDELKQRQNLRNRSQEKVITASPNSKLYQHYLQKSQNGEQDENLIRMPSGDQNDRERDRKYSPFQKQLNQSSNNQRGRQVSPFKSSTSQNPFSSPQKVGNKFIKQFSSPGSTAAHKQQIPLQGSSSTSTMKQSIQPLQQSKIPIDANQNYINIQDSYDMNMSDLPSYKEEKQKRSQGGKKDQQQQQQDGRFILVDSQPTLAQKFNSPTFNSKDNESKQLTENEAKEYFQQIQMQLHSKGNQELEKRTPSEKKFSQLESGSNIGEQTSSMHISSNYQTNQPNSHNREQQNLRNFDSNYNPSSGNNQEDLLSIPQIHFRKNTFGEDISELSNQQIPHNIKQSSKTNQLSQQQSNSQPQSPTLYSTLKEQPFQSEYQPNNMTQTFQQRQQFPPTNPSTSAFNNQQDQFFINRSLSQSSTSQQQFNKRPLSYSYHDATTNNISQQGANDLRLIGSDPKIPQQSFSSKYQSQQAGEQNLRQQLNQSINQQELLQNIVKQSLQTNNNEEFLEKYQKSLNEDDVNNNNSEYQDVVSGRNEIILNKMSEFQFQNNKSRNYENEIQRRDELITFQTSIIGIQDKYISQIKRLLKPQLARLSSNSTKGDRLNNALTIGDTQTSQSNTHRGQLDSQITENNFGTQSNLLKSQSQYIQNAPQDKSNNHSRHSSHPNLYRLPVGSQSYQDSQNQLQNIPLSGKSSASQPANNANQISAHSLGSQSNFSGQNSQQVYVDTLQTVRGPSAYNQFKDGQMQYQSTSPSVQHTLHSPITNTEFRKEILQPSSTAGISQNQNQFSQSISKREGSPLTPKSILKESDTLFKVSPKSVKFSQEMQRQSAGFINPSVEDTNSTVGQKNQKLDRNFQQGSSNPQFVHPATIDSNQDSEPEFIANFQYEKMNPQLNRVNQMHQYKQPSLISQASSNANNKNLIRQAESFIGQTPQEDLSLLDNQSQDFVNKLRNQRSSSPENQQILQALSQLPQNQKNEYIHRVIARQAESFIQNPMDYQNSQDSSPKEQLQHPIRNLQHLHSKASSITSEVDNPMIHNSNGFDSKPPIHPRETLSNRVSPKSGVEKGQFFRSQSGDNISQNNNQNRQNRNQIDQPDSQQRSINNSLTQQASDDNLYRQQQQQFPKSDFYNNRNQQIEQSGEMFSSFQGQAGREESLENSSVANTQQFNPLNTLTSGSEVKQRAFYSPDARNVSIVNQQQQQQQQQQLQKSFSLDKQGLSVMNSASPIKQNNISVNESGQYSQSNLNYSQSPDQIRLTTNDQQLITTSNNNSFRQSSISNNQTNLHLQSLQPLMQSDARDSRTDQPYQTESNQQDKITSSRNQFEQTLPDEVCEDFHNINIGLTTDRHDEKQRQFTPNYTNQEDQNIAGDNIRFIQRSKYSESPERQENKILGSNSKLQLEKEYSSQQSEINRNHNNMPFNQQQQQLQQLQRSQQYQQQETDQSQELNFNQQYQTAPVNKQSSLSPQQNQSRFIAPIQSSQGFDEYNNQNKQEVSQYDSKDPYASGISIASQQKRTQQSQQSNKGLEYSQYPQSSQQSFNESGKKANQGDQQLLDSRNIYASRESIASQQRPNQGGKQINQIDQYPNELNQIEANTSQIVNQQRPTQQSQQNVKSQELLQKLYQNQQKLNQSDPQSILGSQQSNKQVYNPTSQNKFDDQYNEEYDEEIQEGISYDRDNAQQPSKQAGRQQENFESERFPQKEETQNGDKRDTQQSQDNTNQELQRQQRSSNINLSSMKQQQQGYSNNNQQQNISQQGYQDIDDTSQQQAIQDSQNLSYQQSNERSIRKSQPLEQQAKNPSKIQEYESQHTYINQGDMSSPQKSTIGNNQIENSNNDIYKNISPTRLSNEEHNRNQTSMPNQLEQDQQQQNLQEFGSPQKQIHQIHTPSQQHPYNEQRSQLLSVDEKQVEQSPSSVFASGSQIQNIQSQGDSQNQPRDLTKQGQNSYSKNNEGSQNQSGASPQQISQQSIHQSVEQQSINDINQKGQGQLTQRPFTQSLQKSQNYQQMNYKAQNEPYLQENYQSEEIDRDMSIQNLSQNQLSQHQSIQPQDRQLMDKNTQSQQSLGSPSKQLQRSNQNGGITQMDQSQNQSYQQDGDDDDEQLFNQQQQQQLNQSNQESLKSSSRFGTPQNIQQKQVIQPYQNEKDRENQSQLGQGQVTNQILIDSQGKNDSKTQMAISGQIGVSPIRSNQTDFRDQSPNQYQNQSQKLRKERSVHDSDQKQSSSPLNSQNQQKSQLSNQYSQNQQAAYQSSSPQRQFNEGSQNKQNINKQDDIDPNNISDQNLIQKSQISQEREQIDGSIYKSPISQSKQNQHSDQSQIQYNISQQSPIQQSLNPSLNKLHSPGFSQGESQNVLNQMGTPQISNYSNKATPYSQEQQMINKSFHNQKQQNPEIQQQTSENITSDNQFYSAYDVSSPLQRSPSQQQNQDIYHQASNSRKQLDNSQPNQLSQQRSSSSQQDQDIQSSNNPNNNLINQSQSPSKSPKSRSIQQSYSEQNVNQSQNSQEGNQSAEFRQQSPKTRISQHQLEQSQPNNQSNSSQIKSPVRISSENNQKQNQDYSQHSLSPSNTNSKRDDQHLQNQRLSNQQPNLNKDGIQKGQPQSQNIESGDNQFQKMELSSQYSPSRVEQQNLQNPQLYQSGNISQNSISPQQRRTNSPYNQQQYNKTDSNRNLDSQQQYVEEGEEQQSMNKSQQSPSIQERQSQKPYQSPIQQSLNPTHSRVHSSGESQNVLNQMETPQIQKQSSSIKEQDIQNSNNPKNQSINQSQSQSRSPKSRSINQSYSEQNVNQSYNSQEGNQSAEFRQQSPQSRISQHQLEQSQPNNQNNSSQYKNNQQPNLNNDGIQKGESQSQNFESGDNQFQQMELSSQYSPSRVEQQNLQNPQLYQSGNISQNSISPQQRRTNSPYNQQQDYKTDSNRNVESQQQELQIQSPIKDPFTSQSQSQGQQQNYQSTNSNQNPISNQTSPDRQQQVNQQESFSFQQQQSKLQISPNGSILISQSSPQPHFHQESPIRQIDGSFSYKNVEASKQSPHLQQSQDKNQIYYPENPNHQQQVQQYVEEGELQQSRDRSQQSPSIKERYSHKQQINDQTSPQYYTQQQSSSPYEAQYQSKQQTSPYQDEKFLQSNKSSPYSSQQQMQSQPQQNSISSPHSQRQQQEQRNDSQPQNAYSSQKLKSLDQSQDHYHPQQLEQSQDKQSLSPSKLSQHYQNPVTGNVSPQQAQQTNNSLERQQVERNSYENESPYQKKKQTYNESKDNLDYDQSQNTINNNRDDDQTTQYKQSSSKQFNKSQDYINQSHHTSPYNSQQINQSDHSPSQTQSALKQVQILQQQLHSGSDSKQSDLGQSVHTPRSQMAQLLDPSIQLIASRNLPEKEFSSVVIRNDVEPIPLQQSIKKSQEEFIKSPTKSTIYKKLGSFQSPPASPNKSSHLRGSITPTNQANQMSQSHSQQPEQIVSSSSNIYSQYNKSQPPSSARQQDLQLSGNIYNSGLGANPFFNIQSPIELITGEKGKTGFSRQQSLSGVGVSKTTTPRKDRATSESLYTDSIKKASLNTNGNQPAVIGLYQQPSIADNIYASTRGTNPNSKSPIAKGSNLGSQYHMGFEQYSSQNKQQVSQNLSQSNIPNQHQSQVSLIRQGSSNSPIYHQTLSPAQSRNSKQIIQNQLQNLRQSTGSLSTPQRQQNIKQGDNIFVSPTRVQAQDQQTFVFGQQSRKSSETNLQGILPKQGFVSPVQVSRRQSLKSADKFQSDSNNKSARSSSYFNSQSVQQQGVPQIEQRRYSTTYKDSYPNIPQAAYRNSQEDTKSIQQNQRQYSNPILQKEENPRSEIQNAPQFLHSPKYGLYYSQYLSQSNQKIHSDASLGSSRRNSQGNVNSSQKPPQLIAPYATDFDITNQNVQRPPSQHNQSSSPFTSQTFQKSKKNSFSDQAQQSNDVKPQQETQNYSSNEQNKYQPSLSNTTKTMMSPNTSQIFSNINKSNNDLGQNSQSSQKITSYNPSYQPVFSPTISSNDNFTQPRFQQTANPSFQTLLPTSPHYYEQQVNQSGQNFDPFFSSKKKSEEPYKSQHQKHSDSMERGVPYNTSYKSFDQSSQLNKKNTLRDSYSEDSHNLYKSMSQQGVQSNSSDKMPQYTAQGYSSKGSQDYQRISGNQQEGQPFSYRIQDRESYEGSINPQSVGRLGSSSIKSNQDIDKQVRSINLRNSLNQSKKNNSQDNSPTKQGQSSKNTNQIQQQPSSTVDSQNKQLSSSQYQGYYIPKRSDIPLNDSLNEKSGEQQSRVSQDDVFSQSFKETSPSHREGEKQSHFNGNQDRLSLQQQVNQLSSQREDIQPRQESQLEQSNQDYISQNKLNITPNQSSQHQSQNIQGQQGIDNLQRSEHIQQRDIQNNVGLISKSELRSSNESANNQSSHLNDQQIPQWPNRSVQSPEQRDQINNQISQQQEYDVTQRGDGIQQRQFTKKQSSYPINQAENKDITLVQSQQYHPQKLNTSQKSNQSQDHSDRGISELNDVAQSRQFNDKQISQPYSSSIEKKDVPQNLSQLNITQRSNLSPEQKHSYYNAQNNHNKLIDKQEYPNINNQEKQSQDKLGQQTNQFIAFKDVPQIQSQQYSSQKSNFQPEYNQQSLPASNNNNNNNNNKTDYSQQEQDILKRSEYNRSLDKQGQQQYNSVERKDILPNLSSSYVNQSSDNKNQSLSQNSNNNNNNINSINKTELDILYRSPQSGEMNLNNKSVSIKDDSDLIKQQRLNLSPEQKQQQIPSQKNDNNSIISQKELTAIQRNSLNQSKDFNDRQGLQLNNSIERNQIPINQSYQYPQGINQGSLNKISQIKVSQDYNKPYFSIQSPTHNTDEIDYIPQHSTQISKEEKEEKKVNQSSSIEQPHTFSPNKNQPSLNNQTIGQYSIPQSYSKQPIDNKFTTQQGKNDNNRNKILNEDSFGAPRNLNTQSISSYSPLPPNNQESIHFSQDGQYYSRIQQVGDEKSADYDSFNQLSGLIPLNSIDARNREIQKQLQYSQLNNSVEYFSAHSANEYPQIKNQESVVNKISGSQSSPQKGYQSYQQSIPQNQVDQYQSSQTNQSTGAVSNQGYPQIKESLPQINQQMNSQQQLIPSDTKIGMGSYQNEKDAAIPKMLNSQSSSQNYRNTTPMQTAQFDNSSFDNFSESQRKPENRQDTIQSTFSLGQIQQSKQSPNQQNKDDSIHQLTDNEPYSASKSLSQEQQHNKDEDAIKSTSQQRYYDSSNPGQKQGQNEIHPYGKLLSSNLQSSQSQERDPNLGGGAAAYNLSFENKSLNQQNPLDDDSYRTYSQAGGKDHQSSLLFNPQGSSNNASHYQTFQSPGNNLSSPKNPIYSNQTSFNKQPNKNVQQFQKVSEFPIQQQNQPYLIKGYDGLDNDKINNPQISQQEKNNRDSDIIFRQRASDIQKKDQINKQQSLQVSPPRRQVNIQSPTQQSVYNSINNEDEVNYRTLISHASVGGQGGLSAQKQYQSQSQQQLQGQDALQNQSFNDTVEKMNQSNASFGNQNKNDSFSNQAHPIKDRMSNVKNIEDKIKQLSQSIMSAVNESQQQIRPDQQYLSVREDEIDPTQQKNYTFNNLNQDPREAYKQSRNQQMQSAKKDPSSQNSNQYRYKQDQEGSVRYDDEKKLHHQFSNSQMFGQSDNSMTQLPFNSPGVSGISPLNLPFDANYSSVHPYSNMNLSHQLINSSPIISGAVSRSYSLPHQLGQQNQQVIQQSQQVQNVRPNIHQQYVPQNLQQAYSPIKMQQSVSASPYRQQPLIRTPSQYQQQSPLPQQQQQYIQGQVLLPTQNRQQVLTKQFSSPYSHNQKASLSPIKSSISMSSSQQNSTPLRPIQKEVIYRTHSPQIIQDHQSRNASANRVVTDVLNQSVNNLNQTFVSQGVSPMRNNNVYESVALQQSNILHMSQTLVSPLNITAKQSMISPVRGNSMYHSVGLQRQVTNSPNVNPLTQSIGMSPQVSKTPIEHIKFYTPQKKQMFRSERLHTASPEIRRHPEIEIVQNQPKTNNFLSCCKGEIIDEGEVSVELTRQNLQTLQQLKQHKQDQTEDDNIICNIF